MHGFAEHAGRFERTAARLQRAGWNAHAVTLKGHGRRGIRPDIDAFDDYLPPIIETIDQLAERGGGTEQPQPIVLLGQSMGALVACRIALRNPAGVSGLILSSPAFGVADQMPQAALGLLGQLSRWLPNAAIIPPPRGGGKALSQILEEQTRFEEDPLCWHGRLGLRMAHQLACASKATEEGLHGIGMPTLMLWGDADTVVNPEAMRRASSRMQPGLVTTEVWPGARHHLFTDRDAESHFLKIRNWLAQHWA
jgi:alpha-beta hydrolase superfamily lysophospholipase